MELTEAEECLTIDEERWVDLFEVGTHEIYVDVSLSDAIGCKCINI